MNGPYRALLSAFLLGFSALSAGCKGSPEADGDSALRGQTLTRSDSLAIPVRISVVDDKLAVIDLAADRPLHFFDRASGKHLWSALGWGDGPDEVRGPWSIHVHEGRGCVWDPQHSRLVCVQTPAAGQSEVNARSLIISDTTLRKEGQFVLDIAIASDTLLVGTSFSKDGLFALINYRTGRLITFIAPELAVKSEFPSEIHVNGDIKMRPGTDQIVFAPRFGGEIFLIALSGVVREINGPVPFDAEQAYQSLVNSDPRTVSRRRWGYISIDVTQRALYGLFSGKVDHPETRQGDSPAWYGRELHVFEWATEQWRRFELDTLGVGIAVQEPYVYMLVREPLPEIRVYEVGNSTDVAVRQ